MGALRGKNLSEASKNSTFLLLQARFAKKTVIKSFWLDKSPSLLYNVNRLDRQGDIL
jgi:hypothetical protein